MTENKYRAKAREITSDPRPWMQLKCVLAYQIERGILEPGDEVTLASEAQDFEINLRTASKAFNALVEEGKLLSFGFGKSHRVALKVPGMSDDDIVTMDDPEFLRRAGLAWQQSKAGDMRTETDPAGPFRFMPVGPFLLRDYSDDDPDHLKVLRGLLEEIQAQHKLLIPGQLTRLIRQWEADLSKAIEAKSEKEEDKRRTERPPS